MFVAARAVGGGRDWLHDSTEIKSKHEIKTVMAAFILILLNRVFMILN
jgi:hypothetical protein